MQILSHLVNEIISLVQANLNVCQELESLSIKPNAFLKKSLTKKQLSILGSIISTVVDINFKLRDSKQAVTDL